jgi:hypothetical protein
MNMTLDEMRRQIATVALGDAKHAIDQAINKVKLAEKTLVDLGDDGRYAVYSSQDAEFALRRIYTQLNETIDEVGEIGKEFDGEGNELEPIYKAQDAAHEVRYGLDNEYDLD